MGEASADLSNLVAALMAKKSIKDYKLDFSGSTSKGDGYLGNINFIKVIARPEKGKEKSYHFVIKTAKKSDEFRKQTPVTEAFGREIFMYTKVFPILQEFQIECGLERPFDKFARCYSVCSETKRESLILKNMKMAGYEIHDRKEAQNLNHALFVFQNYGKFHAASMALRRKKPAVFRSLTKNMIDVLALFINQAKTVPNFVEEIETGINALKEYGKTKAAEKYDGFVEQMEMYLTKYADSNSSQSVILHGDCWNNNMMFKYEGGNKNQPVDMCFIDFQLSKIGSPVHDLSYYLYTCADKSVLDNFDFLLQAYYSSLSKSLKDLGCDVETILTFNELQDHWKKYGKFGLSMAPFIIKIELSESDEVVDFAEMVENGGFEDAFSFEIKNQDVYLQRLVDVLSHFADKFL